MGNADKDLIREFKKELGEADKLKMKKFPSGDKLFAEEKKFKGMKVMVK